MTKDDQTIQWQKTTRQYNDKRRPDNTMTKDDQTIQCQKTTRQYNDKTRPDNTMTKGKRPKIQTMIYKTLIENN